MSLKVTLHEKMSGIFIVSPSGSLDTNTYMILKERVDAILKDSPKVIVFDLEQLDYISSMGVGVIIHAQKEIKKQEGTLRMVNLKPQIKKVFDVIHALPSQQVFESMQELDDYLDQLQKQVNE